jgi:MFS family permease
LIAARYGALLRRPGVVRLLMAGLAARLPLGMYSLAVLLLVQGRTGSYPAAGAVTAAAALGYAVVGPIQGRLVDRLGQTLPLLVAAGTNAGSFLGLLVAVDQRRPLWLVALVAAAVGASLPQVASCQRALWGAVLSGEPGLLGTALTVDPLQFDLALIVGPLAVAAIAAWSGPAAAVVVSALLIAAGTVSFAALPVSRRWRSQGRPGGLAGPLAAPGVWTVIATIVAGSTALGAIRIGLVGFAGGVGSTSDAGLLVAAFGAGSLAGGLWYGGRAWRSSLDRRYTVLLLLFAAGVAPMALAPSLPVMAALTAVGGLALAPVTACQFQLMPRVAPPGTTTEAYGWMVTSTFAGSAAGSAIAGAAFGGPGWRGALLTAVAALVAAAVVAGIGRDSLQSRDRAGEEMR